MDLSQFTAEQIDQLKAMLAATDTGGRTPEFRPRQLHDLRLAPTKTDARPLFIWSADAPRNNPDALKTHEFPKLLWHGVTGQEVTVPRSKDSKAIEAQYLQDGYVRTAPHTEALDPLEKARRELDALSPEDRALVLEMQQRSRMETLKETLAGLSAAELASLTAAEPKRAKKSA